MKLNKLLPHIYALILFITAMIMLPVMNSDYLFTIQDNSIFINGHTFMKDMLAYEGGWLLWVSCYLTQFFYHPWIGSIILIIIWILSYYLLLITTRMFKNKWCFILLLPFIFFLYSILSYGYWIYYVKIQGYVFYNSLLFFICVVLTLIICEALRLVKVKKFNIITGAILSLCCVIFHLCGTLWNISKANEFSITMSDDNFHHELSMYRAIDEGRYEDVIEEAKNLNNDQPTNLMVLFKNIALMHTDRLPEMFQINNCGITPKTDDSLKIRISQLAAPLIYYQFGQMNYAYRWAMENSVKHGLSFRNVKIMALASIFNQDFAVAAKYINILKQSVYYRDWAFLHERWIQSSTDFIQSQEYQTIAPLLNDDINELDTDNGFCERWILDHFSNILNPTSEKLEDLLICSSLWSTDEYAFCVHFHDYYQRHKDEHIPALYQEGALLLGNAPESPITLYNFPFDEEISMNFNQFVMDYNDYNSSGADKQKMMNLLKERYSDTFWFYYYFYNDFNIY